jgi:hypothetical protein
VVFEQEQRREFLRIEFLHALASFTASLRLRYSST